jgi:hypothetical protein
MRLTSRGEVEHRRFGTGGHVENRSVAVKRPELQHDLPFAAGGEQRPTCLVAADRGQLDRRIRGVESRHDQPVTAERLLDRVLAQDRRTEMLELPQAVLMGCGKSAERGVMRRDRDESQQSLLNGATERREQRQFGALAVHVQHLDRPSPDQVEQAV